MKDRQHYVFLQEGEILQQGDEYLDWEDNFSPIFKQIGKPCSGWCVRRPVPTAQPTETCKTCFGRGFVYVDGGVRTHPPTEEPPCEPCPSCSDKPTEETCKWKRRGRDTITNPHYGYGHIDSITDCPTCGRRIEVTS